MMTLVEQLTILTVVESPPALAVKTPLAPLLVRDYWLIEFTKVAVVYAVAWLGGLAVIHHNVRVNYTRKINHFVLFLLPLFLSIQLQTERSLLTGLVTATIFLLFLGTFAQSIRERAAPLGTMFRSFDRPEDRPYTLLWLSTQVAVGYAVLVPAAWLFADIGKPELIFIPILINGIGDGLAEPVGVRFGRHRYTVRALHGDRRYVRTLEGSACVLLTSIVVLLLMAGHFSTPQLIVALATIPLLMTLAEARSPHTWDTPFLFLTGSLSLLGIVHLVP